MPRALLPTSRGPVLLFADALWPDLVMVHGFKRSVANLLRWRDRLPGVAFLCLPGHEPAPPVDELSLAAWTEAWREALQQWPRPPLIIAESLGAMVALGVGARAVVAVEPLLSVDQLWPLQQTMRAARARGLAIDPREEALFAAPFDKVLAGISSPTLVIAGDAPLWPPRDLLVEPSLLTDADFAAYAAHPLVEAHRISGGHALMDQNPEGVLALARPFLARV